MTLRISNRDARRLWLDAQGLAPAPTGPATPERLMAVMRGIGFVQLDTIRVVARAHDHIMWSRAQNYREGMLDDLVKERRAFEHFTHDASILPVEFYPYWRRQFGRMKKRLEKGNWKKAMPSAKECAKILERVAAEGPLSTKDFDAAPKKTDHAWGRPPHKYALDYYWHTGALATCHRRNFIKHYQIPEKVIPAAHFACDVADDHAVDWLCGEALSRLGFATEGDIQRFWDAVSNDEAKAWVTRRRDRLQPVEIVAADKSIIKAFAPADIEERLAAAPTPTSRLRLLNPFDPVVRDRKRLAKLFGFDYRIEIFTPAAKRQYGYYTYPILEGDRFIGRAEVRANRKKLTLTLENLWWERGVTATPARKRKLDSELARMARFVGVDYL